ncbi:ubiquitin carboxyl-terminal hydrolase 19 [Phlyctema vagabunda]|uniref:Ubiquitin carboxyl-terminal hydrolase 19 n=1 Tax=Phlyctema vagabunda TaxID=108571 RepID=A0ABR4P208_9HELO
MELRQLQLVTSNHGDRLTTVERRQADDAALKSVWSNPPFPGVLSSTPQQGPVPNQPNEVFEDFDDEQEHNILGALHLDTDDEPVRRGASRANSVRFDVSATQGANWAHNSRNSGDFGLARPNSGFGSHPMAERSLSHKSDGRHSSAGHSVHSVHSVHSAISGRTSSLGLDTNFMIGSHDDDSPIDIPQPPPGLFILGNVPSIIRCWLSTHFSHDSLLYAVVCTGSQRSHLDYALIKELGLLDHVRKDPAGRYTIRLPVYLPEALVAQPISRSSSPAGQLPALTVDFEVCGLNRQKSDRNTIRVFLGSDTLRAHNADLLFSQNLMTLYGDDRNKYSVSFVRPEDNGLFKNLCTANVPPERNELKATAAPFRPTEQRLKVDSASEAGTAASENGLDQIDKSKDSANSQSSPRSGPVDAQDSEDRATNRGNDLDNDSSRHNPSQSGAPDSLSSEPTTPADSSRRDSTSGPWGPWRQNSISVPGVSALESTENAYSRRGGRGMKVLKASRSITAATTNSSRSSSAARTGSAYEPAAPQKISSEARRKSLVGGAGMESIAPLPQRWERGMSESKRGATDDPKAPRIAAIPRSSNPVGGASAFAWMKPVTTKKGTTTTTE